ncbi:MAG TPA: 2-amino-4-hydroxy-6-hydroxymethyldihydropteridine diphosphokinase [Terracidiphilus sp.]|jgi:2-amino-4-hydroxy-6-hydroxymethyldihydropteridine diphosphokinase
MDTAYIGMGSNMASAAGSPDKTLAAAALRLESLGEVVALSSLYSTEPVGFTDQPRFLNAVAALNTELEPHALLHALLQIEKDFGRDRSAGIPNGPRTLDLDILVYGDLNIREEGLEIPHPRMSERKFVLIPLVEIASNYKSLDPPKAVIELTQAFPERSPEKTNAVVLVQSDVWRARGIRNAGSGKA